MKRFVLIFVLLVPQFQSELTEDQKQKLEEYHTECVKETGLKDDALSKAIEGDFAIDETMKKQILCMSKKLGFQNDAGDFQADVIKKKLAYIIDDPSLTDEIIEKCNKKSDTPEETAFGALECYYHIRQAN